MADMDIIDAERRRGDCFRLLSACFYPPDRKALIEEGVLESLHRLLGEVCPEAAPGSEGMARALSGADEGELAVAHAKLFVGPFALQAPPYGSVYLETHKRLMGDTTMEVLNMYRRAGLFFSDDFNDAPDHIAVELEFMHFLVAREVSALLRGDRKSASEYLGLQHEFHDAYLRPWIEPFCDGIRTASEHEFYNSLAESLAAFIAKTPVPRDLPGNMGAEA